MLEATSPKVRDIVNPDVKDPYSMMEDRLAAAAVATAAASKAVPTSTAPPYPGALVDRGDTGAEVRAVQKQLNAVLGGTDLAVDGQFGAGTEAAVRSFQQANGLEVDGKVGPKSWAKLFGGTGTNSVVDDKFKATAAAAAAAAQREEDSRNSNKNATLHKPTDRNTAFLEKLPAIMRAKGKDWEVAAKFQEKWFAHPAATADHFYGTAILQPNIDTASVSMSWILKGSVDTNGRAKHALEELEKPENLFKTEKPDHGGSSARENLALKLQKDFENKPQGTVIKIDMDTIMAKGNSPKDLINQVTQSSPVKLEGPEFLTISASPDPLLGAMGDFSLYAIPLGEAVKMSDHEIKFTPTGVAIYAGDVFEFNGTQYLGDWSAGRIFPFGPPDDRLLWNQTYRDFRQQTGRGGDFVVQSDVVPEKLIGHPGPFILKI